MINLRPVAAKDCRLIWKWANNPEARAASFNSEIIKYNDHLKWFKSKINDKNCYFYIAENRNKEAVGQVRYDVEGIKATISINLDRKFRGQGYGSLLLRLSSKKIFNLLEVTVIDAYIKKKNVASFKAFQSAGFIYKKDALIEGQHAAHFILEKQKD